MPNRVYVRYAPNINSYRPWRVTIKTPDGREAYGGVKTKAEVPALVREMTRWIERTK